MNILITGGAGFIGSQIGYYLEQKGHEVTLFDNMSYGYEDNLLINGKAIGKFIKGDVRDKEFVDICINKDVIIHLA